MDSIEDRIKGNLSEERLKSLKQAHNALSKLPDLKLVILKDSNWGK